MAEPAAEPALARALAERIAAIRSRHPVADAAVLAEIVGAVVSAVSTDISASHATLLREVKSLARTIADTRAEIASINASEITGRHIPSASDELDAIVSHAAVATNTILAACETLDALTASLGEPAVSSLQAATTAIYEACSFQDITGQRITKVVAALKAIDAKVANIVATRGRPANAVPAEPDQLANGPQLPSVAMGQADVDQLLASLG
jgi:chemotaxis protein CheZ